MIDLTGRKFNKLEVIRFHGVVKTTYSYRTVTKKHWVCSCECGNQTVVSTGNLKSGNTKSCGCHNTAVRREKRKTHGMTDSPEYKAWRGIKTRCFNSSRESYKYYGGRGITMCEGWASSFELFYSDLGPMPKASMEVDRIDNNGNYEPGNVRWVTRTANLQNRRNTIILGWVSEDVLFGR